MSLFYYTLIVVYYLYMSKSGNQRMVLENLFGSKMRIKILKFLFRNYPNNVGVKDLARRVQEPYESVKKEMKLLEKIGLVKNTK
jgi:predicted transcriptional regulator